jgi:hypothetical protein
MLPLKKAKVVLRYIIGADVIGNWPAGLAGVGTDVGVVYGDEYVFSFFTFSLISSSLYLGPPRPQLRLRNGIGIGIGIGRWNFTDDPGSIYHY